MKAKNYRSIRGQLYTRREYIKATPHIRIVKFEMGQENEDYDVELKVVANERVLMRDNALEALRISANKNLSRKVGSDYHLKIVVYPHHILREHKYMTGAGADRLSDGMSHAFGKVVGRAAAINKGQAILSVKTFAENVENAMEALKVARSKVPKGAKILVATLAEKNKES
ncbi:MAG: 50S ribosomal protein L16 [Nitrososphaeria archaeon]|nr:50S ribosomal protein L16 [Nitrososphaeria archaeon]